jgi:hypothetical protein
LAESAESLEQQLKNSRTASQKERLQMLWWLKTGQVQGATSAPELLQPKLLALSARLKNFCLLTK